VTRDGGGDVLFMVQSIQRDRLLVLNGTLGSTTSSSDGRLELELFAAAARGSF